MWEVFANQSENCLEQLMSKKVHIAKHNYYCTTVTTGPDNLIIFFLPALFFVDTQVQYFFLSNFFFAPTTTKKDGSISHYTYSPNVRGNHTVVAWLYYVVAGKKGRPAFCAFIPPHYGRNVQSLSKNCDAFFILY